MQMYLVSTATGHAKRKSKKEKKAQQNLRTVVKRICLSDTTLSYILDLGRGQEAEEGKASFWGEAAKLLQRMVALCLLASAPLMYS